MTETRISAAMRAAVGRELSRRVSYPVSESDIRRWALAVYYPQRPPARFIDPVAAGKSRWGGIVAPEEFNPFAWLAAEDHGLAHGLDGNDPNRNEVALGIPSPGMRFQLNGGLDVEYAEPMRPGDVITSTSRLAGYTERTGRLGLMLFTTFEDTWTNDRGGLVKRARTTLIRY